MMNTKIQLGLGRKVAKAVYDRLPDSPLVPWMIKGAEIAADMSKIPVEGALYRRHGVVPDGVAALVSQPLWSAIETGEKLAGAFAHPEKVGQPESVKVSIGCIYGTAVRHLASLGIHAAYGAFARHREQIER